MRVMKFAKIDFFLAVKKLGLFIAFPALACILSVCQQSQDALPFGFLYCLFAGMVFSSLPFQLEEKSTQGFLQMLPAPKTALVKGHFLFSFLLLLTSAVLGILSVAIAVPIQALLPGGGGLTAMQNSFAGIFRLSDLYPLLFGLCVLITGIQNAILVFFHLDNAQAMQILRMLPGFLYFFGAMSLLENSPDLFTNILAWLNPTRNLLLAGICILLFGWIAEVCARINAQRDTVRA